MARQMRNTPAVCGARDRIWTRTCSAALPAAVPHQTSALPAARLRAGPEAEAEDIALSWKRRAQSCSALSPLSPAVWRRTRNQGPAPTCGCEISKPPRYETFRASAAALPTLRRPTRAARRLPWYIASSATAILRFRRSVSDLWLTFTDPQRRTLPSPVVHCALIAASTF
jgi:hypothetical protein